MRAEKETAKRVVLLLGGARSGKSYQAQEIAKKMAGEVLFVATATAGDEDMRARIAKHREDRPPTWRTLEAPLQIGCRIEAGLGAADIVIIDCITLLVNNLFCQYEERQFESIEDSVLDRQVSAEIMRLKECIAKIPASFIIISNEVGLGIVPDNRMGRLYRDCLGRANQLLAEAADEVYLMVAGIPLRIKLPGADASKNQNGLLDVK
jgi:adenosylcobinamide kinase/adenosylcobinamide-phosphate guanylyltransferase